MRELILVLVFAVSSVLGYVIIKKVPSLLHTPLMSGMNALSGVTVLGAILAAAAFCNVPSFLAALLAVALATINVAGGFSVTNRMLRMLCKKSVKEDEV